MPVEPDRRASVPLPGAVLPGGRSSRFGADKAMALLGGKTLLDHAVLALAGQCDAMVTVGVDSPGLPPDLRARLAPGPACDANLPSNVSSPEDLDRLQRPALR
jgi:molybdopterin-guanine dinucleotide biosynthesis protein A